jgi:vacuolar-type H+-ATPase subunit E/Vma4
MTLEAARDALLSDARAVTDALLAAAEAEARERVAAARREASEIVARARARGEAEGRLQAAREAAQERTLARMDVLAAQREGYDELRRRARYDVLGLREEAGYAELLERLAATARRDLGAGAEQDVDPPGLGGIRAHRGSRSVDYTLVALADRCVAELGPALPRLWA